MKTVFMGSAEFALPALRSLNESQHIDIDLIITQPPRRSGRDQKLDHTPVGKEAESLGLEIFTPEDINSDDSVEYLKKFKPEYLVVAAFGQILQSQILDIPELAPINLHASLLPKYRGASPIQHAIINGEKKSGVTTIYMDEGLDSGDILKQSAVKIEKDDTAGSLHDKLAEEGADLLLQTLQEFSAGSIEPQPQDEEKATYTPTLKSEDGEVNFASEAEEIVDFIRGFNPWPGAFTYFRGKRLKLWSAASVNADETGKPGKIIYADRNNGLQVGTADENNVRIESLQLAGSRRMEAGDFINGYQPEKGEFLGENRPAGG